MGEYLSLLSFLGLSNFIDWATAANELHVIWLLMGREFKAFLGWDFADFSNV